MAQLSAIANRVIEHLPESGELNRSGFIRLGANYYRLTRDAGGIPESLKKDNPDDYSYKVHRIHLSFLEQPEQDVIAANETQFQSVLYQKMKIKGEHKLQDNRLKSWSGYKKIC